MATSSAEDGDLLRIGELSRRVGVRPEVLRAWERRYGLLSPARTGGGFRLYGPDDERRVRRMREHMERGLSPAEAAARAREEPASGASGTSSTPPEALGDTLRAALDRFDDAAAHTALDRLLGSVPLDRALDDAILPYLVELGERWERGEVSVAQEHFASSLLHGRLLALARDWGDATGPRALLACLPGEQHTLGLICFGLALHAYGWRITFLGSDTPLATVLQTARQLDPALVVMSATVHASAARALPELLELSAAVPLALGGHAVSAGLAAQVGAHHLDDGPVSAAAAIASAAVRA